MRPRLLDMFCCAGGAGMGYYQAGFDVVGVDIDPQPNYPFQFIQADCLTLDEDFIKEFDAVHASPPCQAYTKAQKIQGNSHPELVVPIREILQASGLTFVIENVVGAPLIYPILLCGTMFPGLRVYRHREFESNISLIQPFHPLHVAPLTKMGRPVVPGNFMHVVGNFSGVTEGRIAMGIDWMTRNELREAIPPAYTKFIGEQILHHIHALSGEFV